MVALKDVKASNSTILKQHESLTAVFTGATAGIGLATLQAFAKYVPKPKAIIVGRSRSKFDPDLQKLTSINPDGEYIFVEAEISLIKNVDTVCEEIKRHTDTVDRLYMSQGFLHFGGRQDTKEGLDLSISLRYYGRVRFAENLLPIMTTNARILTVLAGGGEGKVFEDDLDLEKSYSMLNAAGHFTTLTTLTWDNLAFKNPDKAWLHAYPGFVNTGLLGKSNPGVLGFAVGMIEKITAPIFGITAEEAGERMLYYSTADQFAKGSWSIDGNGVPQTSKNLVKYREQKGFADVVEKHNKTMFDKALAN